MKNKNKKKLQYILLIYIILLIDFSSKKYISSHFSSSESIQLTNFLDFTYIRNFGFAFNILSEPEQYLYRYIIIIISLILLLIFIKFQLKSNSIYPISYSMIIGGSFGNLLDRIITGTVTDFISIHINKYYFPIFNLADFSIFIGVILMIINIMSENKKN